MNYLNELYNYVNNSEVIGLTKELNVFYVNQYFEIHDETHGQEKEGELERMCEIADYISRYIKNNPESFLYGKKITLSSESCDRLGDVKICNFDPETDETFSSSEQFHYGYFDGYFYPKEDFPCPS